MKLNTLFVLTFSASLFLLGGCEKEAENANDMVSDAEILDQIEVTPENAIQVIEAPVAPEFPGASLSLKSPGSTIKAGSTTFDFMVNNYELGAQTSDVAARNIANSDKGQHIHFILNNDPYSAHYESKFTKDLPEGNHVLLAFLSRSYHESVKNPEAAVIKKFKVGNPAQDSDVDLTAPHMFYSRPKGTYSGADTDTLLLDFYLANTDLSATGNRIIATVNGKEFLLDAWKPYYIIGAPKGTLTVKLELQDKTGKAIESPFNPVTREITLN